MEKTLMELLNDYTQQGIDPVTREDELWQRFGQRQATLVLDSSGFTKTVKALGIVHYLSKLTEARSISIPIVKKYGSKHNVLAADNVVALFDCVDDAFKAAKEISETLRQQKVMLTAQKSFQVCGGIGYGDLLVDKGYGEFYGLEVNLASKLGEDVAEAGELMLTENAYTHLQEKDESAFIEQQHEVSGNYISCYLTYM